MAAWFSRRVAAWKQWAWAGQVRTAAGLLVPLVVLVFFGVALAGSWSQISPYLYELDLTDILMGQLLTVVAFLLGGVAWFFVQMAFGFAATVQDSIAVHILSNATKYVPGYGWQYLSKGYLAKRDTVSAGQVSLAIMSEVVILLSAGVVIGSITASFFVDQWRYPWPASAWEWSAIAVVTLVATILWYRYADQRLQIHHRSVRRNWLAGAWLTAMVGWVLYAASCWFFIHALQQDLPPISLAHCLVALVAAGIASIVVVVVPGGLGVREATLAFLLVGLVPFALGMIVSILMRVSVMLSELVALGAILLLAHTRSHWFTTQYPIWISRRNTPK